MSASPPPTGSPRSRKRSFDAIDGPSPSKTPADIGLPFSSSHSLPGLPTPPSPHDQLGSAPSSRLTSPAPSSSAVSISADVLATSNPINKPALASQPNKKRKLTFAEKEAKRTEKEAKDREKAEEKARKDDEKRVKDEEKRRKKEEEEEKKRIKEVELAEKKQAKDAEKQAKEEEKRRKEEEKNKKARVRELQNGL